MYTICKDIKELNEILNHDLKSVKQWLDCNKLSLNVSKTELLILGSNQRLSKIEKDDLNVSIDGVKLQQVTSCKHLGVIIDENLSWNDHVESIVKKSRSGLYMLNKVKPYVPSNTMNMIYNSLLAPYFDYCDVIWGTCNSTTRHKVQKMQNRAAKIITGGTWYDSSTAALNTLHWYNIKERYEFHLATAMYKIINGHTPSYLCNRFHVKTSGYELRGHKRLTIPIPKTEFKKRSISYSGATLWNSMTDDLKTACNISQFRAKYNI